MQDGQNMMVPTAIMFKGTGAYTKIDNELIRQYPDYFTADIPGLAAGNYTIKIVPVSNDIEITSAAQETGTIKVDNYIREGFAFSANSPYGYTTGGYNKDGTIKSDAEILYITNKNKDTVTLNGDASKGVGLFNILAYREAKKITTPLVVRFIGKVEMPKGTENYMLGIRNTQNVTLEGVGEDATIHGWGLTMKRACNIEVRNIGIMWYGGVGGDGDSLSLDTENKNIWLHNIDFFYGAPSKDSDQAKGDGSIDLKSKSDYITTDNNHFWNSGKSCVAGGVWEAKNPDEPEAKIFVTYHHNWFDHSDSRHPRCVAGSVHVYNNYYDGCAKYGIGAAVQSSVFSESNYYRNVKRPMIIATQGSDVYKNGTYADKGTLSGQTGGMIKQYGDIIITPDRFVNQNTTPDKGQIDAYTVTNRNEKVPDTIKAMSGGSTYNNFDTAADFYDYTPDKAEDVPAVVMANAGRLNGGDFKWEFTAADDAVSDVDIDLQNAILNYESKLIRAFADDGITEEETDTTTEVSTETITENKSGDDKTETTTNSPSYASSASWNADIDIPGWLNIGSATKGSVSSSHPVFADTDSEVAQLKNRYTVTKNSEIKINISSPSTVKVYIAGNNNGAGKGTITAELDGSSVGSYSLPSRQNKTATPFEITLDKAGTLLLKNSYESLLYKIEILSDGNTPNVENYTVPVSIINNSGINTIVKIGDNEISVSSGSTENKTLTLAKGRYTITADAGINVEPSLLDVSQNISTAVSVFLTKKEAQTDNNVIVMDANNNIIGCYDKISEALADESTVEGSVISVKPGVYNDGFDVDRSVTIQKAAETSGEVIIYNTDGVYGKSMKGAIRVSGNGVKLKNLTLLNNTNSSYGGINAASTSGTTAAALIADGENSVFDNCKFISVQDTVVTANKTYKQTYNNCTFYGATDFVCGSCDVDFNNCEFRMFTGSLSAKADSYIFAPNINAKWRVNGGKIVKDENCIVTNFFYARAWESNSSDAMTLDIYGTKLDVKMCSTKGLMGFGGPTGGGKSHSISEFKFNVYEGADSSTPIVATTDVTNLALFEMSSKPCVSFSNDSSSKLMIAIFGENVSDTFIENVLPDVVEIGFVSAENADKEKINEMNTIASTAVYRKITSVAGSKNELDADIVAPDGAYIGSGVVRGLEGSGTITVVPYVKFDASYGSKEGLDETPVYRFGKSVEIAY